MNNYIFVLLLFFVGVSCEKETEVAIPHSASQIVVSSILIPDKEIKVFVSQSIYMLETEQLPISNAEVSLFSNNQLLEILSLDTTGVYQSKKVKTQSGQNYSIKVRVNGFDEITASTQVPYSLPLDSIQLKTFIGTSDNGISLSSLDLFFTSGDKQLSYYQYNCHACTDSINVFGSVCVGEWFSYDAIILEEGDIKSKLFTNKLFNSTNIKLNLNFEDPTGFFFDSDTANYTLSAQIYSLSEDLYLYQKSLNAYAESTDNIWQVNNPPQIYSNIKNGIGIFASMAYSNVITQRVLDQTK
ncbi:MAG: DUF4249 domain-containing protein [Salinivirgaceae bacterium]|nr:DUF4249 domain-containing protein [Salinivirgaceae bacterium]